VDKTLTELPIKKLQQSHCHSSAFPGSFVKDPSTILLDQKFDKFRIQTKTMAGTGGRSSLSVVGVRPEFLFTMIHYVRKKEGLKFQESS
jgi:hypothetical protein